MKEHDVYFWPFMLCQEYFLISFTFSYISELAFGWPDQCANGTDQFYETDNRFWPNSPYSERTTSLVMDGFFISAAFDARYIRGLTDPVSRFWPMIIRVHKRPKISIDIHCGMWREANTIAKTKALCGSWGRLQRFGKVLTQFPFMHMQCLLLSPYCELDGYC